MQCRSVAALSTTDLSTTDRSDTGRSVRVGRIQQMSPELLHRGLLHRGRQRRILHGARSIFPEARRRAAELPKELHSFGALLCAGAGPLEDLHEPHYLGTGDLRVAREARQAQVARAGNGIW